MITVISGTNRSNSNSIKVARSCYELLLKKGISTKLLSLTELPKEFIFNEIYNDQSESYTKLISEYIEFSEKFVFVIPEYNGSFPGVLKAFIDSINYLSLKGKRACMVGLASGHAGALRPLDHFTDVLHHLNMEVFSNKPKLSNIESLTDSNNLIDKDSIKKLSELINQFIQF